MARSFSAFEGASRIGRGSAIEMAEMLYERVSARASALLVFDDADGRQIDLDLRGDLAAVRRAAAAIDDPPEQVRRGRGRPKLGVVAKEVTLLPRHWAWLQTQRGGASATLRRLVDDARRASEDVDAQRRGKDASFRFLNAIAGNLVHFEDAIRALYAGDRKAFATHSAGWSADVRDYARELAGPALAGDDA